MQWIQQSARIAMATFVMAAGTGLVEPAYALYQADVNPHYSGDYQSEFTTHLDRVRLLVNQAQLEVSSRLGLFQYQQGFQYPLTIRFQDGAPAGLESSLAYVRLSGSEMGFQQELVINLAEMAAHPADFDQVFYHEMTHAVLNDAVGGEASLRIPHWVQEGLAQYVSGEGPQRVRNAAEKMPWASLDHLLWDINSPYSGYAYPQYYLDIQYILDKGTINALQGFVRDLIDGKSTQTSLKDVLTMDLSTFQNDVRTYSLDAFQKACDRGAYHNLPCQNLPPSF